MKPISRVICAELGLVLDSEAFALVLRQSALYLTNAITAFEFQHSIKDFTFHRTLRPDKPSAKVFRLHLIKHAFYNLHLKLYLLRISRERSVSLETFKVFAEDYGISPVDGRRLSVMWDVDPSFRRLLRERGKIIPKDSAQWHVLTHEQVFEMMYAKLRKYVSFGVRTKLKFVSEHHNVDPRDLVSDVMALLWARYCRIAPVDKDPLYLINTMKSAATNAINNMCDEYTTQKNGRIIRTSGEGASSKFLLLVRSTNQSTEDEVKETEEQGTNPFVSLEMSMSIQSVLNKELDRDRIRLLSILLGKSDKQFTQHLQGLGVAHAHEDNVDVQDRLTATKFNHYLAAYFEYTQDTLVSFLRTVGNQLVPEKINVRYGT